MELPKDPMILLSYMNTQLRDFYPSLEEFCKTNQQDRQAIEAALAKIDYHYKEDLNRFC